MKTPTQQSFSFRHSAQYSWNITDVPQWCLAVNNRWINHIVIARWRTIFFYITWKTMNCPLNETKVTETKRNRCETKLTETKRNGIIQNEIKFILQRNFQLSVYFVRVKSISALRYFPIYFISNHLFS
jgi:hypothetical protein